MRYVLAVLATLAVAGSSAASTPGLTGSHPCAGIAGFTCSTLRVPLDRSGRVRGMLGLNVAVADNTDAPRGVLLLLAGGPGQPGAPVVMRIADRLGAALRGYRLVTIDQRGTGGTAIDCPQLQAQVGTSDIAAPTPSAVRDCARRLGLRSGLYSTQDTVADLDLLRRALGVRAWTVDGVSYGTFVAERYAVAHPAAVTALVLDSVLPHLDPQADEALYLVGLRAEARVLRAACADIRCGYDPAAELAWLVRHGVDGVALFDAIVTSEFADPTYQNVIATINVARHGARGDLDLLIAQRRRAAVAPPEVFSAGLHAATLCSDLRLPWGSAVTLAQRRRLLDRWIRGLPERAVWPYDKATAAGNGFIATCLYWPAMGTPANGPVAANLPAVPTLLLNGDRDLSTPLEWAREEARHAPRGKLVVVHGASHSVQNREVGDTGRRAVEAFLRR